MEKVENSRISLKSLKDISSPSGGWVSWTATLYVDDKKIGFVEEQGTGGPLIYVDNDHRRSDELVSLLTEIMNEQTSEEDYLDVYIADLEDSTHMYNKLKRQAKANYLVTLNGGESYYQFDKKKYTWENVKESLYRSFGNMPYTLISPNH